jgi:soluble lytic murein transglycosylase-like protein
LRRTIVLTVALAALVACSGGGARPTDRAAVSDAPAAAPSTTASTTTLLAAPSTTTTTPTPVIVPPPGPKLPADPAALADALVAAEQTIRDPAATSEQLDGAARVEQLAYRRIGEHPEWDNIVFPRVPPELTGAVATNVAARREFLNLTTKLSDTLPAWRIVEPAPADELLAYYREAEARYGVGWSYLAAINLVETGMGRIVGLSTAGAQGPMQFIPSTWDRYGEGDINSPHDSILAAARYLNANGFADGNIDGALFRYNNHNNYVRGVEEYAAVMAAEPVTFAAFHRWQIVYRTTLGDVVLPTGYESLEPVPAADYLATHPQT